MGDRAGEPQASYRIGDRVEWGEVRLVEFAPPDKNRPAVILTRPGLIRHMHAVTVAPISRRVRGSPTELVVGVDEGLKEMSAVNLLGLETVRKERVGRYLGTLRGDKRRALREALLFSLGLDDF